MRLSDKVRAELIADRVIHQDFHEACHFLPTAFADLVILDPPYNLTKNYNGNIFRLFRMMRV